MSDSFGKLPGKCCDDTRRRTACFLSTHHRSSQSLAWRKPGKIWLVDEFTGGSCGVPRNCHSNSHVLILFHFGYRSITFICPQLIRSEYINPAEELLYNVYPTILIDLDIGGKDVFRRFVLVGTITDKQQ